MTATTDQHDLAAQLASLQARLDVMQRTLLQVQEALAGLSGQLVDVRRVPHRILTREGDG